MKPQSAKSKGRVLQQWVVKMLLNGFPTLTENDIRSTPMGVNGPDVQLSEAALKLIPLKVETKNQQGFGSVYEAYHQACAHKGAYEPVVFVKKNREKPLAIIDAEYFLSLQRKLNDNG